ncbi:hypothetical protein EON68_01210, partial [archaeon]
MTHDAYDVVTSILAELQVLGKKVPHPMSAAGRKRWAVASGHAVDEYCLPTPSPSVNATLTPASISSSTTRSRASMGRAALPEADGEGAQNADTLADFSKFWIDRLEQGRRARKRQRTQVATLDAALVASMLTPPPPSRSRARSRRTKDESLDEDEEDAAMAAALAASAADAEAATSTSRRPRRRRRGEAAEAGEDEAEGAGAAVGQVSGRKRARPVVVTEDQWERDARPDVGLPSISNLRIRLTPAKKALTPVVVPLGPSSRVVVNQPSLWAPQHPELPTPTVIDSGIPADEDRAPAVQAAHVYMPARMFDASGMSRADAIAAMTHGVSQDAYRASGGDAAALPTAPPARDPAADNIQSRPPSVDAVERARVIGTWLMANRTSAAEAAGAILP